MRGILRAVPLAVIAGVVVVGPTSADAVVNLGATFVPGSCGSETYIQTVSPGNTYTVPYNGVITSWSYQAGASQVPTSARLKIGRVAPGTDLTTEATVTIVGESTAHSPIANALNTYPTEIPVQPGDLIGEYLEGSGLVGCSRSDDAFTDHYRDGDVPVGTSNSFTEENFQQDIAAVLVPSNSFTFNQTTRNKKKGTAALNFTLPNPGDLTGSGNGVSVASAGAAVISKSVAAGPVQLLVKARGKKKRKLNETGKVKVQVVITYTPASGDPSTQSVNVKLKKKTKKR